MNIPQGQPGELKRTMKTRHLFYDITRGCIGTGFSLVQVIPSMKQVRWEQ